MRGRIKGKGRATVDRAKTGRGKSVGKDGLAGQPLQRDLRVLIDFQVFVETGEGAMLRLVRHIEMGHIEHAVALVIDVRDRVKAKQRTAHQDRAAGPG